MDDLQKEPASCHKTEKPQLDAYCGPFSNADLQEEALRENALRLQATLRAANVGLWDWDLRTNRVYYSPEWKHQIGYQDNELTNDFSEWQRRVHPDDLDHTIKTVRSFIKKPWPNYRQEFRFRHKDGSYRWILTQASIIHDDQGRAIRMLGSHVDITERKREEEELMLSRQWLSLHVQRTPLAVVEFDIEGRIRGWNPAAEGIFGFSREEALGQYWTFIVSEAIWEHLEGVWESLITKRGGTRSTNENLTKSGKTIICEWFSTPLIDQGGNPIGVASLVMDITERKIAEAEREQFYKFFQTSSDLMAIADPNGAFIKTNPACTDILGYSPSELVSKPFIEFIHPEDKQSTLDEMVRQLQRGFSINFENRYICRNGSVKWLSWRAIFNKDEGITYATARDITANKEAEERIRQSEEFIRSILDTVDEGFIVVNRDYRILTANKAYCSQVGDSHEKIIGKHCYEVSHRSNRPCYDEGEECAVRQVFESGKSHAALHRHKDIRGDILYVETKAYPICDASGAITSVIETINNITEKHLLEKERLKSQKLESIGTLAGGIAHDFNNLLQGVFGYISLARVTHDQKEKSLAMLEQAEKALHMSVNLTTQLLTFSKGGKPVKKLVSIRAAVEDAVKFALSGSHTNYEMDIPFDLWSVEADEGQIAQVIQNIVLNANEAMASSGTVSVSLANADIAKGVIAGLPEGGQFVCIAIKDSGIGIPEQNLARIFDPYFTTKQKGSGLGLATSYSIIKNHGGVIEVKSELNKGTTFTIYLPAFQGEVMQTIATTSDAVGTAKGKILLMDDEKLVRDVASEMVSALGHEVVCAEDGRKAIELFRKARESCIPFDLVILDLTVKGGMGGEEALRKMRDIDPDVKAVVSSGYADSPIVADYGAYGFSAFLNKPYKLDTLQNCFNLFIL